MTESVNAPSDPAARFYQRNFERLTATGQADDYSSNAAIIGGVHRYSAAFEHLAFKPDQIVLEMGYGGHGIIELLAPLVRDVSRLTIQSLRDVANEFRASMTATLIKVVELDRQIGDFIQRRAQSRAGQA